MKKNYKKVLISGLTAIAFGAISVGTTFALFTDEAKTNIEMQAGIVDVSSTAKNLLTYSCEANANGDRVDEKGNKYISKLTAVEGEFTNGGNAALSASGDALTLHELTPGDRVTFDVDLGSESNVNYKFRINYKYVADDKTLAKGLVTKMFIGNEVVGPHAGLVEYTSAWVSATPNNNNNLPSLSFDIELPIDKGNEYQGKTGRFVLTIETVQGNASTSGEEEIALISEDIVSPEATAVANEPTVVTASDSGNQVSVKTTIPADAAQVTSGDKVQLVVSDLTISEAAQADEGSMSFDATLYVNGTATPNFSQPVLVEIQLAELLEIKSLKHNGVAVADFNYDALTGKLSFSTTSFSPFVVTYAKMARNTLFGFYDSYVEDGHWVHEVTNLAEFKNILDHIHARSTQSFSNLPVANKDTEYRITANLDFDGAATWGDAYISHVFTGRLVGKVPNQTNAIISNFSNTKTYQQGELSHADAPMFGLFGIIDQASFENITLNNCAVRNSGAKGAGLFAPGFHNASDPGTLSLAFKNIIVNDNCVLEANANAGGFIGETRLIKDVSFLNCHTSAKVLCKSTNVGGFIGSGTTQYPGSENSLSFVNCSNNGIVTAGNYLGGFTGNTGGNRTLELKNCVDNSTIQELDSGATYIGHFFPGNSWFNSVDAEDNTIGGTIYRPVGATGSIYEAAKADQLDLTYESAANYAATISSWSALSFTAAFDENHKLQLDGLSGANISRISVQMRQHGLRVYKDHYWIYGDNQQTSEVGGPQESETNRYLPTIYNFNSVEACAEGIREVTQVGFFKPAGSVDIKCSYDADYNNHSNEHYYQIDDSHLGQEGYENGYHIKADGTAYIVIDNISNSDAYLWICRWRNYVMYEIAVYDSDGLIIGTQTVYGGIIDVNNSWLEPISL